MCIFCRFKVYSDLSMQKCPLTKIAKLLANNPFLCYNDQQKKVILRGGDPQICPCGVSPGTKKEVRILMKILRNIRKTVRIRNFL